MPITLEPEEVSDAASESPKKPAGFIISPEDFLRQPNAATRASSFLVSPEDFLKTSSTSRIFPEEPLINPSAPHISGMELLGGVQHGPARPPRLPLPWEAQIQQPTPGAERDIPTRILDIATGGIGKAAQGIERAAGPLESFVIGKPGEAGMPRQSTMTPAQGKELAGGAADVISGTLAAATPLVGGGIAAAPLHTLVTLAAGTMAQKGVKAGLDKLGVAPEYADLAAEIAALLAGYAAAKGRLSPQQQNLIEVLRGQESSGAHQVESLKAMADRGGTVHERNLAREFLKRKFGVDYGTAETEPAAPEKPLSEMSDAELNEHGQRLSAKPPDNHEAQAWEVEREFRRRADKARRTPAAPIVDPTAAYVEPETATPVDVPATQVVPQPEVPVPVTESQVAAPVPQVTPPSLPILPTTPAVVVPTLQVEPQSPTVSIGSDTIAPSAPAEAVWTVPEPQPVTSFETAQGSTYTVDGETTTRTKSLHKGHDPKDVGLKEPSQKTVYVDPKFATEVGMWNTSSGKQKLIILKDGKVMLISRADQGASHGRDPLINDSSFSTTPAVGLSPLELTNMNGVGAYAGNHPGNAITKISPTIPQLKSAPAPQPLAVTAEEFLAQPEAAASPAVPQENGVVQSAASETKAETHSFGSTQVNLPSEVAEKSKAFAATIPKESLTPDGIEENPHITLRYGNNEDDHTRIAAALAKQGPITAKIKGVSIFPNVDTEHGKADVVKLDIDSPDMHRLNALVGKAVPHPGETFPKYVPHITVAYLRAGEGKKYAGRLVKGLSGQTVTFNSVAFSPKSGPQVEIPLKPKKVEVIQSSEQTGKRLDSMTANQGETPAQFNARKAKVLADHMKAAAVDISNDQALAEAANRIAEERRAKQQKKQGGGKIIDVTSAPVAPSPLHESLAQSGFDKPYTELTPGQQESVGLRAERQNAPLPKPEKKPVTPQVPTRIQKAKAAVGHRREVYTPGNIVTSYFGQDKVLQYEEKPGGDWRVQALAVGKQGEPLPNERPRWHRTEPGKDTKIISREPPPEPIEKQEATKPEKVLSEKDTARVTQIDKKSASLQGRYEQKMKAAGGFLPPAITKDVLDSIARQMDKLDAERRSITGKDRSAPAGTGGTSPMAEEDRRINPRTGKPWKTETKAPSVETKPTVAETLPEPVVGPSVGNLIKGESGQSSMMESVRFTASKLAALFKGAPEPTIPEKVKPAWVKDLEDAMADLEEAKREALAAREPTPIRAETPPAKRPPAMAPAPQESEFPHEIKPSKLAHGVESKAIENNLTAGFHGIPEYETVNVREQAQMAADLLRDDHDLAIRIAMGRALPPNGLLPESVFVAVENQATANGDAELLRDLATASTLSMEATGMGQRIRMLAERSKDSPVGMMQQVLNAREAAATKRYGSKAKAKIKTDIKESIRTQNKQKGPWILFIESIKC